MKTDDLISMLATGAGQESAGNPWHRLMLAIGFGTIGSTFLMLKTIHLNPELGTVMQLLEFWEKLGFAASIAAISLLLVFRLSQPGVGLRKALQALIAPIVAIWILAGIDFAGAEHEQQATLFFGSTWKVCPFLIAMLASPVFIGSFWAMRDLAPTRLRLAGAAAGLFSGAVGAVVYCFHCPELDAPFIAFWYLLGMLIPAAAGALVGPKLLRW
jgi:hypothetical protein